VGACSLFYSYPDGSKAGAATAEAAIAATHLRPCKNAEELETLTAEGVLGEHAGHGAPQHLLGLLVVHGLHLPAATPHRHMRRAAIT